MKQHRQGWLHCLRKCRRLDAVHCVCVLKVLRLCCAAVFVVFAHDFNDLQLPPSFRPRLDAQERLLAALLAREGARSTAVTAPKSRISSQGMGGVGKTMLTAAGT